MEGRNQHRGGRPDRGGGKPGGRGRGPGNRPQGPSPLEVAVRTTRNAIGRHAEKIQNHEARLACRGILTGIVGGSKNASNPGEVMNLVELVMHALEANERNLEHLPIALRGALVFALEHPGRTRNATEMLRLTMRHAYAVAADHIPRQSRDDGGFRASSLCDALDTVGGMYLDDAAFAAAAQ